MTDQACYYRGLIGSRKCEAALEEILTECDDQKITHLVMSQWNDFVSGLYKLSTLEKEDFSFYKRMLALWRHDRITEWELHLDRVPKAVFTHLRTCMVSEFREVLKNAEKDHAEPEQE